MELRREFDELLIELPYVGWLFALLIGTDTYFRLDTADMFQGAVRRVVKDVVEEVRSGHGLAALGPELHTPQLREFVAR